MAHYFRDVTDENLRLIKYLEHVGFTPEGEIQMRMMKYKPRYARDRFDLLNMFR